MKNKKDKKKKKKKKIDYRGEKITSLKAGQYI
jgi:hypothetical protein